MNKLNKKVFLSIFSIISLFILFGVIVYNYQSYKKEYDDIYRNLNFIDGFKNKPKPKDSFSREDEPELDNMMIMDYEVYTVKIKNNSISKIIIHSEMNSDFDVEKVASNIIKKDNEFKIGNLYNNKYSYNYKSNDTLIIINTKNINNKND